MRKINLKINKTKRKEKHTFKTLDLFSIICIVVVSVMFTISTFFIIFQSINAMKMYNNISVCCLTKLLDLKEYFNASITEEIYSLIYAFMSTAIVGLGGYILKKNSDTKDEIKKDLESAGDCQYLKLKKRLYEDSKINILISDVSIAHQYVCAMEVTDDKDMFRHSFSDIIRHINEAIFDTDIKTKMQCQFLSDLLLSITTKYESLIYSGLVEYKNDEGKTTIDYLNETNEIINNLLTNLEDEDVD